MSDSEYEYESEVVVTTPPTPAPPASTTSIRKRKPKIAPATVPEQIKRKATTSTSSGSANSAANSSKKRKPDLFAILRGEEQASGAQNGRKSDVSSSFTAKVAGGRSRRTISVPANGEFFIDLKVYNIKDVIATNPEERYKKALAALKLQCADDSEAWEGVQRVLSNAFELFKGGESVYFTDK